MLGCTHFAKPPFNMKSNLGKEEAYVQFPSVFINRIKCKKGIIWQHCFTEPHLAEENWQLLQDDQKILRPVGRAEPAPVFANSFFVC